MSVATVPGLRLSYETIGVRAPLVLAHGHARGVCRGDPQERVRADRDVLIQRPAFDAVAERFRAR
jgi:hypothetical protein